ncbi:MAG TPA: ATP-binding cassette domain-containing protein [Thermoanaerobaculia bacterium]|nr:ATP-binding cassette domain-containing protein [Thermoanaerobaculia bacterium]
MKEVLRLEHASFWYDVSQPPVVFDCNMSVDASQFVAIVGQSGSGKSTLLRLSCGLLQSDLRAYPNDAARFGGKVRFDGQEVDGPTSRLGYVPQSFQAGMMPSRTARDNILLAVKEDGISELERRTAEELIRQTGIADAARLNIRQLSGGQQQRVAICRALITRPKLLFMDEPFANLDPTLKPGMNHLLQSLRAEYGLAVLMVTHDVYGAASLADVIIGVKPGYGRPSYSTWLRGSGPADIEDWMAS